jgi:cytochrome P450
MIQGSGFAARSESVARLPRVRFPEVSRFRSFLDTPKMIRNAVQMFSRYTAELGDTFVFHFGGLKTVIVTSNPAAMQHVLKTNYVNYKKSEIQMKRMGHFLGIGLLTSHGERWLVQRRLMQKGFTPAKLESLVAGMRETLAESMEAFERVVAAGPVDIYPEMMRMTFRMVSRSLFSAHIADEDVECISHTILTVQEFIIQQIGKPFFGPWFRLSGTLRKHEKMCERGNNILLDHIRQRRRCRESQEDLLQVLLDAVYADTQQGMSDHEVLAESIQLLVAGHETSSNALCWTLNLLSQNPEWIDEIRREFDRVIGDAPLRYADVPKFEYTTQVIDEALRLYPPFWLVDREAIEEDRAGDVIIPAGATVIVFIYGAHHSPALWEDPEAFLPERFSRENRKRHTPFSFLPFGAGPRGCIGGNYAMLQMLLILGAILRRYDPRVAPSQKVEVRPMIILRPKNGIRMTFTGRTGVESAN